MILCDYKCGQEAKHQLSNGKWCCSDNHRKCPENRKKYSQLGVKNPMYGKHHSEESKKKIGSRLYNRGYRRIFSEEHKTNISRSKKGKPSGRKAKLISEETKRKISESLKISMNSPEIKEKLSKPKSEATRKRMSENHADISGDNNPSKRLEVKEKQRQYMLNGGSSYATKFIKHASKEELHLREIVKELCPEAESNSKVIDSKNYRADIVLRNYKVIIEYDGWHHFKDQKSIDYHKKRQQEIEADGWKFIRYNIFERFPTKDQIEKDIVQIVYRT